jgi:Fe-S-cluster containining protein
VGEQRQQVGGEWFDRPDRDTGEVGLRFGCTMCGNCCSGPPGFVLFTEAEGRAISERLGISYERFLAEYTEDTPRGRSIREKPGPRGFDCVLLDRDSIPGKAVCGVYELRPAQCRTWPFWPHLLRSRDDWVRAKATCPGLDAGRLYAPEEIRIIRDNQTQGS